MKKTFVIATFILMSALAWVSCRKSDINLIPTLPTTSSYFLTQNQMDAGVVGIYSKLVFLYNFRGYGGGWLHKIHLLPDDDLSTNNVDPFETFTLINSSNGEANDYYAYLYQLNARANDMLDIFAQSADKVYTDNNLKNYNKGEALFLRGFSHWLLWNYYGIAPVVNKRFYPTDDLYVQNSSGTQLLDSAIADFNAAAVLLPQDWPSESLGRLTKGSALGMAGKALLFWATVKNNKADYAAALQEFSQLSGYSLTANYYDNFDGKKQNNKESLFEIQLGKNSSFEGSNPWLNTDQFSSNGDVSGYYGYFDNHWSLWGASRYIATKSIQDLFTPADPRYSSSLNNNGYILKYVKIATNEPFGASYDNNQRVLRYADVLLMQAECLVQSGGSTAQAVALINKVRARARSQASPESAIPADRDVAVTDVNTIMKWIVDERRIELAFEDGIRWLDLRRWDIGGVLQTLYGKTLETGWNFSSLQTSTSFAKKNLYLPLPANELQLNPKLKQNVLWQ